MSDWKRSVVVTRPPAAPAATTPVDEQAGWYRNDSRTHAEVKADMRRAGLNVADEHGDEVERANWLIQTDAPAAIREWDSSRRWLLDHVDSAPWEVEAMRAYHDALDEFVGPRGYASLLHAYGL